MNKELEEAYKECQRTCGPTLPCFIPEYLEARYKYHQLLLKHGLIDPKLTQKCPELREGL